MEAVVRIWLESLISIFTGGSCIVHWRSSNMNLILNSALGSYPLVKIEIRESIQILTTASIFLQCNYFRQIYLEIASCSDSLLIYIWVRVEQSLRGVQKRQSRKI